MGTDNRAVLPGVTVVVPTYGKFDTLERTLSSVAKQTCSIENVIVSDDGSGKNFPPELKKRFPNMIFRENSHNMGTVAHMNVVAAEIESAYIKFLPAGDALSDPEALESLVEVAEGTDAPAVTSQAAVCDATLKRKLYTFPGRRGKYLNEPGKVLFRRLAVSNIVSAPGTLFRRTFFTDLGGFDESYRLLEDWPAWLRLARADHGLPFLDRVTCLYGMGGISSEALDAYSAPSLRRDMALCYEKEIFPYLDELDAGEVRQVRFGYDQVRGLSQKELRKKYGWLAHRIALKRSVKKCLLKSSQIFRGSAC